MCCISATTRPGAARPCRAGWTTTGPCTAPATSTDTASRWRPTTKGLPFDPDAGARVASPENEDRAREYIATRFPGLAGAPLVGARTCPYALTPDTHFLIAPHPEHERVWLLGGGSGHGFKHGPALAEYVHELLDGRAKPDPRFGLGERQLAMGLRTAGGRGL